MIKCKDIFIDQWIESTTKCDGEIKVEDVYVGKAKIKDVDEYEYLGNVITADGKTIEISGTESLRVLVQ